MMGKMKKDKKWFIDKWTKERNKTDVHDPMYHFINEFIADVSQIDEPEVLSEEWLDENKSSWTKLKVDGYYIPVEKLQNLLVPKQELPVIPEYVADWIKEEQGTMSNWKLPSRFISDSKYKKDQRRYKWSQVEGNMDKFMSALINSYEAEEEQKYNVQLKVRSSFGTVGVFLYKQGDEVLAGDNFKAYYPEKNEFRLTEQEIKDFDPRYWAFRKPV